MFLFILSILFPVDYFDPCYLYNPTQEPAKSCEIPLLVLNYWPYTWENDQWVLMKGYGGQCDISCGITANGTEMSLDLEMKSAACIFDWVRIGQTKQVTIPNFGSFECIDNFGDQEYQQPFFHKDFGDTLLRLKSCSFLGNA